MPDRQIPPHKSLITHVAFIPPEKASLDNGFPVYFLKGGTEDISRIEWIFHAGSFVQKKPLEAFSAINLLKAGTRYKSAEEINEIFDFYGAHLSLDAQKDISSVVVYVLNKNLGPVLELVREIIREPVFSEEEAEIFINNQKQSFEINNQKVQYQARSYFTEALFGSDHPYGYRLKQEDFDNISRDDLVEYHRKWIHGANGLCIVSGKIPVDMFTGLNLHFGDKQWLRPNPSAHDHVNALNFQPASRMFIEKKDALQSAIRIGKRMINMNHPDYHRFMIANALLGGFFGSRLMRNIRQEKGYTYGINSSLISLLREGYFFISSQVGTDVCQLALEEVYRELIRLRKVAATKEELDILKNYLSGNFLRSFDGPFAQSEKFKELLIFDLKPGYFDDFLIELKKTDPEIIMETANKYLHEDSMTEVVAGKKHKD